MTLFCRAGRSAAGRPTAAKRPCVLTSDRRTLSDSRAVRVSRSAALVGLDDGAGGNTSHAKTSQKYGSRFSLERGDYGLHISIPMSGAERVGRFQEQVKVTTERSTDGAAFAAILPRL
ncbi:hypothetical protein EVAR_570_1 [Eumeta japonica]|uniref:Uncharacterized protein n=1 Tax=Eumeta variegata TaxID=151549 RepID=A0A4C1SB88_EUMVA|nr:hypothetical protein EVAR_570_1 [Eumeta japonica]